MTEQIFSTKQNQNIKEVLTGALSILNIQRENRVVGEVLWKFCQQVLAGA